MEQELSPSIEGGVKVHDFGFSILHEAPEPIVDIIFVHGLQGHPRKTWESKGKAANPNADQVQLHPNSEVNRLLFRSRSSERVIRKLFSRRPKSQSKESTPPHDQDKKTPNDMARKSGVFWPLDFLPGDCPDSRILTWGYDSVITHFFGGAANQSGVIGYSKNLLQALKVNRIGCEGRPIIFVAHSLGGIIVKEAVRRAAASASEPRILDIFQSTQAILFLGTPHRGSQKASLGEIARNIAAAAGFDTNVTNINMLKINGAELEFIHEEFMKLYEQKDRKFLVLTFQEAKGVVGTRYLKMNERIVEPFSSTLTSTEPTQIINANHMTMCQFSSRDDEGYMQVVGELRILYDVEKSKIQDRAQVEELRGINNLNKGSPSQATIGSVAQSLNESERKCMALLIHNTSNATEYKSTLPTRVEGTCQWILSNAQYLDWKLKRETCLLWISGYPGSGKTTLSAYLTEFLGTGDRSPSFRTTLCCFFCDEKIDTQRDAKAILRSLIHQLLVRRRKLVKYVKREYELYGEQMEQNLHVLWNIFVKIASDDRIGPISVVVDAIDECEEITRERFLQDVLDLIKLPESTGSKKPCIKFLVTSRPLLGRRYTSNLVQIDPSENFVEKDLRLVIKTKVDAIVQRTKCKHEVGVYLKNALFLKADRTFLWVTLVLHLLEVSVLASPKEFRRIVDELPQTLAATYERFLNGIPTGNQEIAKRMLYLIVGSSRSLTLEEIRIALAVDEQHLALAGVDDDAQPNIQETLEGILGPLVRISNSRVYLVHQSLKEYLQALATQTNKPHSDLFGIDYCQANLVLANACVSYLLLEDFEKDLFSQEASNIDTPVSKRSEASQRDSIDVIWDPFDVGDDTIIKDESESEATACESIEARYPFFDYAARYWAQHFSSCAPVSTLRMRKMVTVLHDSSSLQGSNSFRYRWFHMERTSSCPRDFTPLISASYFGHSVSIEHLLKDETASDISQVGLALYWAARMGHIEAVDLLLRSGAHVDDAVAEAQKVLFVAARLNRCKVVKRLLHDDQFICKTDLWRVNDTSMSGRTALSIASSSGFVEIVSLLLQHPGVEPDKADFALWTPVFWAVGGQHLDVLQLLLMDNRCSVNHKDKTGRNVLAWAVADGELEVVKYLMSLKNIEPDQIDMNGRTAFSWAAGNGQLGAVEYLRRSGRVDPSRVDNDGRNALSWATQGGHHKVVEYLIKHDREGVDAEDHAGWTPLAWALFNRAPETVKVLLESGLVDVNKRDRDGRSPLSFAAGYGFLDIVQTLLNVKGIKINSKDNYGQTPMDSAQRYADIVKVLEEQASEYPHLVKECQNS